MMILHTPAALQQARKALATTGKTLAIVPTMGNLHEGHLSLLEKAKTLADVVLCTIFVNPAQFGPEEDLQNYPRTLAADLAALELAQVDWVFTPEISSMYPPLDDTRVAVPTLSADYCGAVRPGHFTGVATVVCKLLNLAQAEHAIFGEKDFQQLAVIRRMATDLFIQTHIHSAPTRRAADGLALSSRNAYLTEQERTRAPLLYRTLQWMAAQIHAGDSDYAALELEAISTLKADGWTPDYIAICDPDSLIRARAPQPSLVILAAARLGRARLIDNLRCQLDTPS
jgi:pantoate--beta-alanine ligase